MRGCAIIVLGVLFLVTIGSKLGSLWLGYKIETDSKTEVAVIKTYYETGGSMAERSIRHVVGYCAEKDAGGTVPEAFKEYAGDLFIFLLTDSEATSKEGMMREFLNRNPERINRQMAELENGPAVERARIVTLIEKWKEDGIFSQISCVHYQLRGRGLLPDGES